MSAALMILPVVWAFAERANAESVTSQTEGRMAETAARLGQRKGPHGLRLVHAAAVPAAAPAVPLADVAAAKSMAAPVAEVAFYRKYTEAMLRRYVKLSLEAGRVPSLLGQEMFRGKVTSYKVRSFEDVVIFVHDVGKCLELLEPAQRALIKRIAMQGHTQGEAASQLGLSLRTVVRHYADAVDALTRVFLERKLLEIQT